MEMDFIYPAEYAIRKGVTLENREPDVWWKSCLWRVREREEIHTHIIVIKPINSSLRSESEKKKKKERRWNPGPGVAETRLGQSRHYNARSCLDAFRTFATWRGGVRFVVGQRETLIGKSISHALPVSAGPGRRRCTDDLYNNSVLFVRKTFAWKPTTITTTII